MNVYAQPNTWSCLPTCAGMLCDQVPAQVFEELGHDGSEIIHPHLDDPYCRRSFHIREITDYFVSHGHRPVYIEFEPVGYVEGDDGKSYSYVYGTPEMDKLNEEYLDLYDGILFLYANEMLHTCAWDHNTGEVIDPAPRKGYLEDYEGVHAFLALM